MPKMGKLSNTRKERIAKALAAAVAELPKGCEVMLLVNEHLPEGMCITCDATDERMLPMSLTFISEVLMAKLAGELEHLPSEDEVVSQLH